MICLPDDPLWDEVPKAKGPIQVRNTSACYEMPFVTDRDGNKLVAVDLESGAGREVTLEPAPYHLAVVRGMGKLYISSAGAPKIWVVDRNSLAVSGEIPIGGRGHQMVLLTLDAQGN